MTIVSAKLSSPERYRAEISGFVALAATILLLALWIKPIDAFLVGFIAYAFAYCGFITRRLGAASLDDLPANSAAYDSSARAILAAGIGLVFADLVLISLALSGGVKTVGGAALVGLSVLASWTLLHVLFAIHYTHAYYEQGVDGKAAAEAPELTFPDGPPSHFSDFLYFSFVIGMTFQVSDVTVNGAGMRRLVLGHSILSFFLNVFVLSLTITAVGGVI